MGRWYLMSMLGTALEKIQTKTGCATINKRESLSNTMKPLFEAGEIR